MLPELAGRVMAHAIQVPTASVSGIDLSFQSSRRIDAAMVNLVLKAAGDNSPFIGWTDRPLVSSDLRTRPVSIVMSGLETSVSGELVQVFG